VFSDESIQAVYEEQTACDEEGLDEDQEVLVSAMEILLGSGQNSERGDGVDDLYEKTGQPVGKDRFREILKEAVVKI